MRNHKNIAIIGYGSTGVISLYAVLSSIRSGDLSPDVNITIFNNGEDFATGPVYSINLPNECSLINTMSYMADVNIETVCSDNRDFFNWVQQNLDDLKKLYPEYDLTNPDSIVPRSLYGRYLLDTSERLFNFAERAGVSISVLKEKARIEKVIDGKASVGREGQFFDAVYLATGHAQLERPVDNVVGSNSRYLTSGYPLSRLDVVDPESNVAIIGMGFSAQEQAQYLLDGIGVSHVDFISATGFMRPVRGIFSTSYEPQVFTESNLLAAAHKNPSGFLSLDDIIALGKQEIELATGVKPEWDRVLNLRSSKKDFRRYFAAAASGEEVRWFSALLSFRHLEEFCLNVIDPSEKTDLENFMAKVYFKYKRPMPLDYADRLIRYMNEGRVDLPGRFTEHASEVVLTDESVGLSLEVEPNVWEQRSYDYLIRGYMSERYNHTTPEFNHMTRNGIISCDARGVIVDTSRRALGSKANIYALGAISGLTGGTIPNLMDAEKATEDLVRAL